MAHELELKEPRNKHVAGRMLSCCVHTAGMRSQLPVPGRGKPVLMFQEPRATGPALHLSPPLQGLALRKDLSCLSGTIAMYQRRTGTSSEGSTVPRTNYGGSQEIQGFLMPKGVRPQECASQSSLPQVVFVSNSSLSPSTPGVGLLDLLLSTFRNQ